MLFSPVTDLLPVTARLVYSQDTQLLRVYFVKTGEDGAAIKQGHISSGRVAYTAAAFGNPTFELTTEEAKALRGRLNAHYGVEDDTSRIRRLQEESSQLKEAREEAEALKLAHAEEVSALTARAQKAEKAFAEKDAEFRLYEGKLDQMELMWREILDRFDVGA
ncbi:hypothetical protein ACFWAP_00400 [Streptomyces goshikiensis]|uniref:hypothetical protein n=1 Tax=Streptomyces goshikiensis TaxID=1942 RepID=UPI003663B1C3